MLEHFAFVEVPGDDAERVVEQTAGTEVRGEVLRLELAAGLDAAGHGPSPSSAPVATCRRRPC